MIRERPPIGKVAVVERIQNVSAGTPQPLIFPDELPELIEAPRKPARSSAGRVARGSAILLLVALALFGAGSLLTTLLPASAPAAPAAPKQAVDAVPPPDPGAAASSVGAAVASYEMRDRMFANRQMQCADLAKGLVILEERWTEYSTAHTAVAGDSISVAGDRALYARVDQVERSFEHTGCPRP